MAVAPGNYSPDNWSSGYRIRTVDSADKRAELFNDFSYWMVRKFEIEVNARENYDSQLLALIQDNVNYSVTNRARISSLDNQLQPLKSTVESINQYAITNRARISSLDNHLTAVEDYGITNRARISSLDNHLTAVEDYGITNRARISNLDGQLQTLKEFSESNRGRITTLDGRLTSTESELSTLSAMVANPDLSLISNLFGVNTIASSASTADGVYTKLQKFLNNELKAQLVELRTLTSQTNTKLDTLNSTLMEEVKGQLVMIRNNLTVLNASQLLTTSAINSFSDRNSEDLTFINATLKGLKNYDDTSLKKNSTDLFDSYFKVQGEAYGSSGNAQDGIFTKLFKTQNDKLITSMTGLFNSQNLKLNSLITVFNVGNVTDAVSSNDSTFVAMLKNQFKYLASFIKDYTSLLTSMNANQLLTTAAINSSSNKNSEDLTLINATLKGLKNYDDSSFKKIITDYFFSDSRSYSAGISNDDGFFVKLFKGQFTRLIAELNRQLTLSFTSATNNMESFKTYLREEFGLLNDWFSLMSEWLKQIYEKPTAVFENTPFDYVLLQQMLDGISFGNVVNEAGTNVWDVLKELIEAMGRVVEAVVGIVPDLIDKLIALVIPENPNFFSEDIEALTSAFDMKFDWAFNLSDSFQSIFSQPKSLSTLTIPIAGKEYKVVPTFVDLNLIKTILTGYFCFLTLFTSYKRIVGGGDVIQ